MPPTLPARARPVTACPVCGLGLPRPAEGICPNRWCRRDQRYFSVVFSTGVHDGALRRAVLGYKHGGQLGWARVFARMVAGYLEAEATWFEEFDLIAGMPAYTGPGSRRGWDHVAMVLGELAPLVGPRWEVVRDLLVKTAETSAMQGLGWHGRQAAAGALRRSLSVSRAVPVTGARVLVFDDVLTEGSSLREAARVLRAAGAEEVAGLVLARPPWTFGRPDGPAKPSGAAAAGRPGGGRPAFQGR